VFITHDTISQEWRLVSVNSLDTKLKYVSLELFVNWNQPEDEFRGRIQGPRGDDEVEGEVLDRAGERLGIGRDDSGGFQVDDGDAVDVVVDALPSERRRVVERRHERCEDDDVVVGY